MQSEFVNTGVLAAKAVAVINSCKTEAQFNSAKNFAKLVHRTMGREFDRRIKCASAFSTVNLTTLFKDWGRAYKPVQEALNNSPFRY